jgi:hypothetical protein
MTPLVRRRGPAGGRRGGERRIRTLVDGMVFGGDGWQFNATRP